MRAFNGDPARKAEIEQRLRAHIEAGEVSQVPPLVWRNGKGSAVGCMLHDVSLAVWQEQMGVPRSIGSLIDALVMGSPPPITSSVTVAVQWLEALPVGVDLTNASRALLDCMLTHPQAGLAIETQDPAMLAAIQAIGALARRAMQGDVPGADEWKAIRQIGMAASDALNPEDNQHLITEAIEEAAWDPATSANVLSATFFGVATAKRLLALARANFTAEETAHCKRVLAEVGARAKEFSTPDNPIDPETLFAKREPELARRRRKRGDDMQNTYMAYLDTVVDTLLTLTRTAPRG